MQTPFLVDRCGEGPLKEGIEAMPKVTNEMRKLSFLIIKYVNA